MDTVITANGDQSSTHHLRDMPRSKPKHYTVVLTTTKVQSFSLLAMATLDGGRAEWIGRQPFLSQGHNYNTSDFRLNTNRDPVEHAFGVTYCGRKLVSNNGESQEQVRIKFVLEPNTSLRHLMFVVAGAMNTNSHHKLAQQNMTVSIVAGNNDVLLADTPRLRTTFSFGSDAFGTWFIPGIIRIDPQNGMDFEINHTRRDTTRHWNSVPALPFLDAYGNYMMPAPRIPAGGKLHLIVCISGGLSVNFR